ncbi:MAG: phage tail tube protein [Candidatus Saccharimonadales bacterium]
MATGSGLDAQVGVKTEATVGTAVTVDRFFDFDTAELVLEPSYIEGTGLQAGRKFKSVNQVGIARRTATGKFQVPVMQKGYGWFWKHFIGSTGTAVVVSGGTLAFEQYHTAGDLSGISFTTQIGKPEPDTGTVKPFTYNGCKITDWDLTFADNALTVGTFTVDGWDEDTAPALASASYATDNVQWSFADVSVFKIGGTPTTTSGVTSISGGVNVSSVVSQVVLTGKNNLKIDRFGLGNAGIKKEQLEVDFTSITGTFTAEYNSADFQSEFEAGTTTSLQLDSIGPVIESTTNYKLSVILPAIKITKAPAVVSGPGLVTVAGEFMVYDPDDGSNPPIQIHIVSTDTVV